MSEMSEAILKSKLALPNKLLQDDGSITDITGNPILGSVPEYDAKASLPNKFLNADGTYSTLNEIFADIADTDLFVPVETLPEEGDPRKIYLVPNGSGTFDEYHYDATLKKWDPFGVLDVSNLVTTEELNNVVRQLKMYVNTEISKIVPLYPFPESFNTRGTTQEFVDSVLNSNLPVGGMYLGEVILKDMPDKKLLNAEVKVEVYDNNVIYFTMTSADLSPYQWTCNSWNFRGWEPSGTQAAKDYTDEQIQEKITQVLGKEY